MRRHHEARRKARGSRRSCGKRRYRDDTEAKGALHRLKNNSHRDRVPVRSYKCSACKGWHLTSKLT